MTWRILMAVGMPAALWLGAKWRDHRFRRLASELEAALASRRGRTPCVLTRWEGCPAVSYLRPGGGLATVALGRGGTHFVARTAVSTGCAELRLAKRAVEVRPPADARLAQVVLDWPELDRRYAFFCTEGVAGVARFALGPGQRAVERLAGLAARLEVHVGPAEVHVLAGRELGSREDLALLTDAAEALIEAAEQWLRDSVPRLEPGADGRLPPRQVG